MRILFIEIYMTKIRQIINNILLIPIFSAVLGCEEKETDVNLFSFFIANGEEGLHFTSSKN